MNVNQDICIPAEKYKTDWNNNLTNHLNELYCLWDRFEDVPIDEDECIDENFHIWEKGTERFHIWHWFDERCPNGLAKDLMSLN